VHTDDDSDMGEVAAAAGGSFMAAIILAVLVWVLKRVVARACHGSSALQQRLRTDLGE
jgi:flagellar biogenesis protein FliO